MNSHEGRKGPEGHEWVMKGMQTVVAIEGSRKPWGPGRVIKVMEGYEGYEGHEGHEGSRRS